MMRRSAPHRAHNDLRALLMQLGLTLALLGLAPLVALALGGGFALAGGELLGLLRGALALSALFVFALTYRVAPWFAGLLGTAVAVSLPLPGVWAMPVAAALTLLLGQLQSRRRG